ncbi:hypothetical protein L2K20_09740 [Mycobacterium sp. MBM]|nr:hypothetical protein [Mycobacterium sp. MBM]
MLRAGVDVTAFEIACADAALRRHKILIVREAKTFYLTFGAVTALGALAVTSVTG